MAEVGNLFFINSRFTEFQDGFLVVFLLALMMVVSGDSKWKDLVRVPC